jgi:putative flippase GtrA
MKQRLREPLIYAAGAAAAFLTDVSLLWLLVEQAGLHYLLAATLSFLAGTVVVYWVSIRHAFEVRSVDDRRKEFGYFATIGAAGILLNLCLMYVFVESAGLNYLIAKVLAGSFTFVTNFGLRKVLLFSARNHRGRRRLADLEHSE